MFNNQDKYKRAIQQTGPINNTAIYHKSRQEGDEALPMIFCKDDPYFQDLVSRNYRREDRFKTPSTLAWDHKPYGILGEIFNMEQIKKRAESMQ